jgi:glycosyltransferase involved in cell wall biosynthesis
MPTVGIEVFAKDRTYAWDVMQGPEVFRRVTLIEAEEDHISGAPVGDVVQTALERERPSVVALPGWSLPEALASLAWALAHGVPAILMADSQRHDRRRNPLAEGAKRRVVSLCSAALVAGAAQVAYTADLGLARERIFTGYDVVDNEHFQAGAERARADATLRAKMGLPARFFLVSCRFVYEKNLLRLLEAYGRYRASSSDPWSLVLLGDGPLRGAVEGAIRRLDLQKLVLAPGFMQYDVLPAYYGLAGAAILPSAVEPWGLVVNEAMAAGLPVLVSERCGCAPELVEPGRNGFTFDPFEVAELSGLMLKLSSESEAQLEAMGRASQEIISRWTPELFAENLEKAVQAAMRAPRPSVSVLDRALLWLLIRRGGRG